MKKKNWFGLVLSFAAPCKGKLILSTCLQITSVAAGLIPYLAVYRIIQMFFNETASTKGVFLWTGVCLLGYALMLIFHGISTTLSHESAYTILEGRSEERRVGKECRTRIWSDICSKKEKAT